jgi:hypothetical protein
LYFDRYTNLLFDSGSNLYVDQNMQNVFHWDPFKQAFASVESTRKYMRRLALLNKKDKTENEEEKKPEEREDIPLKRNHVEGEQDSEEAIEIAPLVGLSLISSHHLF